MKHQPDNPLPGEQKPIRFDKDLWWEASRKVNPDYTEEQFERDWADFVEHKRRHQLQ